jgi:histidyl-tRNA synthetase
LLADAGLQLDCFVIPLAAEREADARRLAGQMRRQGQRVDFAAAAGNLGKLFKRADALGAATVALVGGAEWERGMVKFRDMKTGAEREEPNAATSPSPAA